MKIEQIISDAAVKAVKALYGIEAAPGTTVPQKTKKEDTFNTLPLLIVDEIGGVPAGRGG